MSDFFEDEESEEEAIRARVREITRVRLMAAGLLSPNRLRTEESFALEMRLRHEAQAAEDHAILALRRSTLRRDR